MAYSIDEKLVIAVASSALFDLSVSERVFREKGLEIYRQYQRDHESDVLAPAGVAFPLMKRLLALNGADSTDHPVEAILLSRNDPDTGLRVFKSIAHHGLDITRAAFVNGRDPFRYLTAFNAALFLSANPHDVRKAMDRGAPAGRVFPTDFVDDETGELRIAFDFDDVLVDDSAEAVFKIRGLQEFVKAETAKAEVPLPVGPLHRFFTEIAKLQQRELRRKLAEADYEPRIRVAIVTARNAPAHERVVTTLREWGIQVDEVFFLGGIDKARILQVFKPHIFFDDQVAAIESASAVTPSAHVPFGIANKAAETAKPVCETSDTKGPQQRAAQETAEGRSASDVAGRTSPDLA